MRFLLSSLAFAASVYSQSAAFLDPKTGIEFQQHTDATTGLKFGIAVPTTVQSDFIGQIVLPTNGTGYAGISLTPKMVGSLFVLAWPNVDSVVGGLFMSSGYSAPNVYTNASVSVSPIANGTFVNSTHMSYTFLCTGCITGTSSSFSGSTADISLGFAVGTKSPTNPTSASSATFVYHDGGFGGFGMTLSGSADYPTWAATASGSAAGGSGNATCTNVGTNTTTTVSNSTYDYIVAGAGPAGIIVAQRLTESGKSVLLLEGGKASTYATGGRSTVSWNDTVTQYDVPSMSYYLTTASDTSEYCTDTASQAGCLLGGGTMVNALMFIRPQTADFDDKWPAGWKWNDVSAAAEKLYSRNPGTTLPSKDGKRYDQGAFNAMSNFLKGMGWSHIDAIEQPDSKHEVYSYPPWDIQNGLRAGPVTSYLPLAQASPNFKLSLETKVLRAVRDGSSITGVEVQTSTGARQIINLKAGGKVVLAGGAMSSPRILFNSGIGPKDQISTVQSGCTGVTLPAESDWIDLPVGQNLRDHPIFTLTFNTTSASAANATSMLASQFTNPGQTDIDLFAKASGPLAQSGQRLNFWSSLNSTDGITRFFQGTVNSPSAGTVRAKVYLTHGATSAGVLGITSTGSTQFSTEPLMNTDEDKAAVVEFLDSILNAARNSTILVPSSASATGASLVASYVSGSHFVGTAMMGDSKQNAVVDTDTKVFGTDNLFVVDASIHPDLPTGNTQAIVMVVAEHAAAKILALGSSSNSTAPSITPPFANSTIPVTTPSNTTQPLTPTESSPDAEDDC